MLTIKELKIKSSKELTTMLAEKREELREMRFKVHERQLKNVSEQKIVRATIARILTIIKQAQKQL
jgi:ribosomal protein L29